MIISHRFQTVFLHIPKNAGTALRSVMQEADPQSDRSWGYRFFPRLYRFGDSAHVPLVDLPPDRLRFVNEYQCFAILRDPLERFLSATVQHFGQHAYRTPRSPGALLSELDSVRIRYDPAYIHFCPQHFYTHIAGRQVVEHLFRMDDPEMEQNILSFMADRGFAVRDAALPRRNAARTEKPVLDDDFDRERFYQLYKRDYDLLGFAPPFDIPADRTFEIDADAQADMDRPIDFSSHDKVHFLGTDFRRNR